MTKSNNDKDAEFVTLAHFANMSEAGQVHELLQNNGIDAVLQGGNFGGLDPLPMVGGFSEIQLLVPAAELEKAMELYDAFFQDESQTLTEDQDVGNQ